MSHSAQASCKKGTCGRGNTRRTKQNTQNHIQPNDTLQPGFHARITTFSAYKWNNSPQTFTKCAQNRQYTVQGCRKESTQKLTPWSNRASGIGDSSGCTTTRHNTPSSSESCQACTRNRWDTRSCRNIVMTAANESLAKQPQQAVNHSSNLPRTALDLFGRSHHSA